jgi:cysteine desulfurase/selenocysteine lyase
VGAIPVDVQALPVDAMVSVGFKWLCGPYGTGVCWLRPELFDALRPTKLYWLSALTAEDLAAPSLDLESVRPMRTGRLDVFGTANFSTTSRSPPRWSCGWNWGSTRSAYVDGLVVGLLAGIDHTRFRLVSSEAVRSPLVVVEPLREASAEVFERLTAVGVHVAHRRGRIRISPHLYNTADEIDRVLELL